MGALDPSATRQVLRGQRALCVGNAGGTTEINHFTAAFARPRPHVEQAIRLGDEGHFQHVFLAALFCTGPDRETAIGLLVDQVRLGTQAQSIVAMAALRAVTGVKHSVADREGWLAWWQLRQAAAGNR